jgi:hypothetical protein
MHGTSADETDMQCRDKEETHPRVALFPFHSFTDSFLSYFVPF